LTQIDLSPSHVRVTTSEIAELAGVSRPTVSNWRRRHADFPAPIATAPRGGDLFVLADVEDWLERHGRTISRPSGVDLLWAAADGARGIHPVEHVVEVACATLVLVKVTSETARNALASLPRDEVSEARRQLRATVDAVVEGSAMLVAALTPLTSDQLDRPLVDVVRAAAVVGCGEGDLPDLFETILDRRRRWQTYRTREHETSDGLAELMIRLAQPRGVVFDPSVGEGSLLLKAGQAANDVKLTLLGQEINETACRMAVQRLLIHGIDATVTVGDSLLHGDYPTLRADVVLCDPPFGQHWPAPKQGDSRWFAGAPSKANADLAWVQHVVNHLSQTGRGYVVLPHGALFRGGRDAKIRSELVRQGCVEAIVALPGGLINRTAIPIVLWVVKAAALTDQDRRVLLINGALSFPGEADVRGLEPWVQDRIAETLEHFRESPTEFRGDDDFSTAAPILDILAPNATLLPARWIRPSVRVTPEEWTHQVDDAQRALDRALDGLLATSALIDRAQGVASRPVVAAVPEHKEKVRVSDICSITRGTSISRDAYAKHGAPVLRSPWSRKEDERFVDIEALRRVTISEPGDVIFIGVGDLPRAFVDHDGGHVLPDFMYLLRPLSAVLDPVVLASLLTAPSHRAHVTGTTIPRINPAELEIPELTPAEVTELRETLDLLSSIGDGALELGNSTETARATLLDAIVSGSVSPHSEGMSGDD